MIGDIKKLKNKSGGYIFPVTSDQAIYTSDGVKIGDKIINIDSELASKANKTELNNVQNQLDVITTQSDNYYVKCLQTDTGALLVVSSGATTGQINLADVKHMSDYTPVAGDYVALMYNTLNAETKGIRIAYDGTIHDTASEAIKYQIAPLSNELKDYIELNVTPIDGQKMKDSSIYADPWCRYFEIDCEYGDKFLVTSSASIYTYPYVMCDSDGYRIYYEEFPTADKAGQYYDREVTIPKTVQPITKLFVNNNLSEYSIKKYKCVNTPNLSKKVHDIEKNTNTYNNIKDNFDNLITTVSPFLNASYYREMWHCREVNAGIITDIIHVTSSKVAVKLKLSTTATITNVTLSVVNSAGGETYEGLKSYTTQSIEDTLFFDAGSKIVYNDAIGFRIIISSSNASYDMEVSEFAMYEYSSFQTGEMYDQNFINMMGKVFSKIGELSNKIIGIDTSQTILKNGIGNSYITAVTNDEQIVAIPTVPTKTLFMGNSLSFGMDTNGAHGGAFGMAATSPQKDFIYLVKQAILSKNSGATFTNLHDAPFEQAESDSAAQAYITNNTSYWTSDLDLVIIQIGDNVNSDIRKTTFINNFGNLIKTIKQNSPKARIICVGCWFSYAGMIDIVQSISLNRGCEFVGIRDLYTTENKGVEGSIVTYYDSTTETIPSACLEHPGDIGFVKIAERIITTMQM